MTIHGQFNKGFIITTFNAHNDSVFPNCNPNILQHLVFLIDQHAADEKVRFEKLEKSKNYTNIIKASVIWWSSHNHFFVLN